MSLIDRVVPFGTPKHASDPSSSAIEQKGDSAIPTNVDSATKTKNTFGKELLKDFMFEPGYVNLNHGMKTRAFVYINRRELK
jgi:hypothetical protein